MSSSARNPRPTAPTSAPFTRKLMFAAAFVLVSAIATLAAFGPQAISLQNLLTPFVGASVAPQQSFKEVEPEFHTEAPAPVSLTGGTLATARSAHTATLLSDGKVLVVGGSGDTSAEVFDPASGMSVATGNTNYARTGHTATKLSDGRVLIAGGGSNSTEIYDPAAGTFANGPDMATARSGHTATAVGTSVVISGGGTDSVEVFNGTGFTSAGSLTQARTNHSAALMNDGRIFIAGGTGSDTAEIYNPADGTSVATGNALAHARAKAHLRVLPDDKVQIIGGNDDVSMEVYDPAIDTVGAHVHLLPDTDTCTGLRSGVRDSQTRAALFFAGNADPAYDRTGHTITEVAGNRALVIGGTSGGAAMGAVTDFASSPATITTDKLDYAPGETVTFSGTGFAAGETVRVVIHEDPHTHTERNFEATADASGNISGSYLVEEHDLNVKFIVNARGLTSNLTAQTAFTDARNWVLTFAGPGSGSVTITPATGTINAPESCGGTGTNAASQTVTTTCSPNITTSENNTTVTFSASPSPGSTFGGWSAIANANSSTCVGTTNPCSLIWGGGGNGAMTVTFNGNTNTTTSVASSANPSVFGQNVTLTATVTRSTGSGSPTGSVQFIVDGVPGSTVSLVGATSTTSTASFSTSSLSVGTHTVVADYFPGSGFNDSTNGTLSGGQVVNKAGTTTTVTSDHLNPLAWTQIAPTGTGPSLITCDQSALADGDGRLIVFARAGCSFGANEVWVLNRANGDGGSPSWQLVSNALPVTRHGNATAYDQANNKLIIFGGCNSGCGGTLNDVWVLSNANGQGGAAVWTQLSPSGPAPSGRHLSVGSYDSDSNRLIIFGGQDGSNSAGATFGEVWILTNANGIGGTPSWSQLATTGTFPLGQYNPNALYDSVNNRLTVVGGAQQGSGLQSNAVNVLTNADGTGGTPTWSNLIPEGTAGAPYPAGAPADYDVAGNRGIFVQQSSPNLYYLSNANGLGGPTAYTLATPSGGAGVLPTYGLGHDPGSGRVMTFYQSGSNLSYYLSADSSSTYGDSVTFTAGVAVNAPGAGTPTGNVQFYDGATPLGPPVALTGTTAQVTTSALTAGVHNITAEYVGDTNFNDSTSGMLPHTVEKAATTTTVTCAGGSVYTGAAIEPCTYTVTGNEAGNPELVPSTPVPSANYTNNINAGVNTASASFTFAGDANHNGSSDSDNFTIGKAGSTTIVTCGAGPFTYSGAAQEPCSATVTGAGGLSESVAVVYSDNVNAGTATATATYAESANHLGSSDSENFTIDKATPTATITCPASVTYNGSAQTPCTAAVTGPGGLNQTLTVNYSNNTNAGTANASASYPGDSNYNGASDTETFQIAKAATTTTVTCPAGPYVYAGAAIEPCSANVTGAGGLNQSLTVNYFDNVNAGSATASASYAESANHLASSDSENFTIGQATSHTTVTCPTSVVYNSDAQEVCTVSVTGGTLNLSPPATYANNVNVGTATASYTYPGDGNHAGSSGSDTFDITAVALTINGAVANHKVYDGDNVATVNFGSAALATVIAGDTVTINSGGYSATFDDANVGDDKPVTVTGVALSGAEAGNYTVSQPSGLTADITAKQLTLVGAVAQNKVYDGETDAIVNFDDAELSGLETGDTVSFDVTNADAQFADKNVNTAIAVTLTGVVLTGSEADNYELADPTILVADITPRLVTVTINPQTKVYDGDTSATLVAADFVVGNTVTGEDFTVNQTAGAYNDANVANATTVTATLAEANFDPANVATLESNYDFPTTASGTGTITKAPTTTTVTFEAGPYVYRGTAFTATANVTGAGGLNQAVTPVTYGGDCTNVTTADGCSASATYAESANHFSSTDTETITITPATPTVSVTFGATPITYDGNPHPATVTVTGVSGSLGTPANGTTSVSYTRNAAPFVGTPTDAGSYTASATFTSTNANYTNAASTTDAVLTIEKAASVTEITCPANITYTGSALTPCTVSITGAGGLNQTPDPVYTNNTNAGTANASYTYVESANHLGSNDSQDFTIDKASTTTIVTCTDGTYTGSAVETCEYTVTGASLSIGPLPVPAGNYANNINAGTETSSASYTYAESANHLSSNDSDTFTIAKATAVVMVMPYDVTYDGQPHTATVTSITGVNGENGATVGSVDVSGTTHTNAGTYNDTWSFTGTANYNEQLNVAITNKIDRAPVTATAGSGSGVYNGLAQSPSACVVSGAYTGSLSCVNSPASVGPGVGTFVIEPVTSGADIGNFVVTPANGSYTITNVAPTNVIVSSVTIDENGTATISGSFTDPDAIQSHVVTVNWGDGSSTVTLPLLPAGTLSFSASKQFLDDNPTATASNVKNVTVTVSDGADSETGTATVTINNVDPVITSITGQVVPISINTSVNVTTAFTDVGTLDTHSCLVNWDDGGGFGSSGTTVTQGEGSGSCSANKTFTSPGVYTVTVRITDDDTGDDEEEYTSLIVVYDPNAGFVTGGGFIDSPAGASLEFPTAIGKANFGFVSKYKKGSNTPEGQTEFQFKAGNLNFHSSAYDTGSLVISSFKAQYKGTGTVNGQAGYRFVLTAYDGQINGAGNDGNDKFRIKIIRTSDSAVVYDNARGAADDIDTASPIAISGGSIVIHKGK